MSDPSILESAAVAAAAALSDVTLKICNPIVTAAATLAAATSSAAIAHAAPAAAAAAAAAAPIGVHVPTRIIPAVPLPVPERDPCVPTERDVIVGSDLHHRGTMLLHDLIRLHFFLWKQENSETINEDIQPAAAGVDFAEATTTEDIVNSCAADAVANSLKEEVDETKPKPAISLKTGIPPSNIKDVEELTTHITQLFTNGRPYELSGLKDVPTPFFKGEGRFFEQITSPPEDLKWRLLDEDRTKAYVAQLILSLFQELWNNSEDDGDTSEIIELVNKFANNSPEQSVAAEGESTKFTPRPFDVVFESTSDNASYYEPHQSGNKHVLFTASKYVSVKGTNKSLSSSSRIKAAFAVITSQIQVNNEVVGTELIKAYPRYFIQHSTVDGQSLWVDMNRRDLAEFATIFVFEVYLEKRVYEETAIGSNNLEATANVTPNSLKPTMHELLSSSSSSANEPSDVPIASPTTHDVLFGRGGMTNGHPGNRRFRDIIALHRPDYIHATKMDKPNVARKIVRAIRSGNPPGRFLKKWEDNMWRDVGDKVAAEKTSQGLREKTNAEKRRRSAVRESTRVTHEETTGNDTKREKLSNEVSSLNEDSVIPPNFNAEKSSHTGLKNSNQKGTDENITTIESLPANAVDKDGNVLVTDHDILCGRGGLTNHHKGNKRYRDIVALHRPDYVRAAKIQKPSVARVIVRAIRNGDPPGRFLKKDATTGKWIDIGDKKAAEKTSQALREKPDDEKEGTVGKTTPGFTSPTMIVPPPNAATAAAAAAAAATNIDAALGDAALGDAALLEAGAAAVAVAIAAENETKGEPLPLGDITAEEKAVKNEEPSIAV